MEVPIKHPRPDAKSFRKIILGKKAPSRVPFIELHIDKEIVEHITEKVLDRKWVEPLPDDRGTQEACLRNYIECWYKLGYDCIRMGSYFRFSSGLVFEAKARKGEDTAFLSKGTRQWTEEGKGIISSWEDFEKYPWPNLDEINLWSFEFVSGNLPDGMGLWACPSAGVLEISLNNLLGYEALSYLLYDDSNLVKAVFDRVGGLIYGWYEKIIGLKKLVGFLQGDDMGFKTSTLLSPDVLRKYVLPWHKKFAELAHNHGLVYVLHTCGNVESIMEDLIKDVKIDAKHSFEDEIEPVAQFKKKYGDRIGVLGGVDMDKLCRLEESELRKYVRGILNECMPGGRYALGSGNSVANYIPVKNFLIMLDEGLKWRNSA